MSASPSSDPLSVTIATLRAAGCVFAEDEAQLLLAAAADPEDLAALVERRVAGLPLEQVLGWAEFCGLRIAIEPGVFVPRRRTEFLIREAAALVDSLDRVSPSALQRQGGDASVVRTGPVILDLCCGSGAMGVALASALAESGTAVDLYAADVEPAAVRCARRNVLPIGGQVFEGDLYDPLPDALRGQVDVLVANAPYVPTDAISLMPPEARLHEPLVALDGGADGLDVLRRVIAEAPAWLAPGGHLLFETSERQAPYAVEAVRAAGLEPRQASDDDLGATVVTGTRPSS